MQSPNAWHWKYQDREIRDDVEDPRGLKGGINAKTVAGCHERIPNLLAWSAYGDLKHGLDEIEYQAAPDTKVDPNKDEHVAFSGWCKDAKVLEQNGELDEEDYESVDDG